MRRFFFFVLIWIVGSLLGSAILGVSKVEAGENISMGMVLAFAFLLGGLSEPPKEGDRTIQHVVGLLLAAFLFVFFDNGELRLVPVGMILYVAGHMAWPYVKRTDTG